MSTKRRHEVKTLSLSQMADAITSALRKQAAEPNLYGYKPHPKQEVFHKADTFGRIFIGGNRSGKTVSGVVEDIWWATKRHPYRRIPSDTQIRGRAVSVDFVKGVKGILLPVFKRWVLPSDLKHGSWDEAWDNEGKILTFVDGSTIDFLTYEQSLDKHAGVSRHFVHFDEEPPQAIFGENMLRLLDVQGVHPEYGKWWLTMTPADGITWVNDTLVDPQDGPKENVTIVKVLTTDNPHMPNTDKVMSMLDADEQKARGEGAFVPRGGRVFPEFQTTIHATLPYDWYPPKNWTIWTSTDSGWNNPTCHLYTAVSPDMEEIVTFHELYGSGWTVKDSAKLMRDYEKAADIKVYQRVGDPAMKQHAVQTGTSVIQEYGKNGIWIAVDSIPKDTSIGVDKIRQYLRVNPKTGLPRYQITRAVKMLPLQLKKLEWESIQSVKLRDQHNRPETIKKKDDHAPDALRYNFTCFPDLTDYQLGKREQPKSIDNDYIKYLLEAGTSPEIHKVPSPQWETEVGFDFGQMEEIW